jgi:hypothetical protein
MNTPIPSIPDERLREIASQFRYPPTPDVAGSVVKRLETGSRPRAKMRSAWVVTGLLVLLLVVLFAVPGVRAEIVRFFQVGVVRILPATPTQPVESSLPQVPTTVTPMTILPITATPQSTTTPLGSQYEPPYSVSMAGLAGETTLADAQSNLPFKIRLLEYPANLGTPGRVFLQEDGQMVILVWTDPNDSQKALLSLYEIGPGSVIIQKFEPRVIRETQVNGQYAVWVQGPYMLQLANGMYDFRRLVGGNTLIWEEDKITYRLESDQALEDTLKIAESLK